MDYKGLITFREGFKTFPEFKEVFENTWVFKKMHPTEKDKELKTVWNLYKKTYSVEDGLSTSTKKSGKVKPRNGKQSTFSGSKKD